VDFCQRLGDDALILGQRLSEWCGHAPALEVDLSLANLALDLIGQGTHFLGLAGDADKLAFLTDMGLEEPGLNRVIRAAYALLGLQTYFTAGPKEVRAWTVRAGATAPQAAGVIHTDFERGFIRAEVASYDDFVAPQGEQGAKEAGKLRLEGKDYTVRDGDVIHFRFNV